MVVGRWGRSTKSTKGTKIKGGLRLRLIDVGADLCVRPSVWSRGLI